MAATSSLIGFSTISQRLALIVGGLRVALAALGGRDRTVVPIVVLAWTRVGRLAARFEALVARLQEGRLAPTRRPAPLREAIREAGPPPPADDPPSGAVRLPRGFGWLIRLLKWEAVAYGSQLQALLAEPGMAELLKADPRAGSILRPLCRMLAIKPEGGLALPPIRRRRVAKTARPQATDPETAGPPTPRSQTPRRKARPATPVARAAASEAPSAIAQVWAALLTQTHPVTAATVTPNSLAEKPPWRIPARLRR